VLPSVFPSSDLTIFPYSSIRQDADGGIAEPAPRAVAIRLCALV
jgi:hypothetical protein